MITQLSDRFLLALSQSRDLTLDIFLSFCQCIDLILLQLIIFFVSLGSLRKVFSKILNFINWKPKFHLFNDKQIFLSVRRSSCQGTTNAPACWKTSCHNLEPKCIILGWTWTVKWFSKSFSMKCSKRLRSLQPSQRYLWWKVQCLNTFCSSLFNFYWSEETIVAKCAMWL